MAFFSIRTLITIAFFFSLFVPALDGRAQIIGRIRLDTTLWAPVAYLSLIPDFNQIYSISNEAIIKKSGIDGEGNFTFDIKDLPLEDHLYRLHFSKKGDPQASLVIGGEDENHLFLIANKNSTIGIGIPGGRKLIGGITFSGYKPNKALLEINQIAGFLDTLDYYGPAVNRDFVRQAVYDKLRLYADTCSNPLISLYALYHSRFESNYPVNIPYYQKYLKKWRKENSEYFRVFRAQLPAKEPTGFLLPLLILGVALPTGAAAILLIRKRKKPAKGLYQSLTVQERKIFNLLKDGRSNKEISDECGISLSTVKSHVNNIYSKLNITSRTDVMDFVPKQ
jgi:DNA-binding CsgD family transcriptional regulator